MKTIRILLADDHAITREGLALLVNSQSDMQVVAQASDGLEACERARALQPDVAVLDLSMPGRDGLKAAEHIHRSCPRVKVIGLSMYEDVTYLRGLLKAGAVGYVLKRSPAEELLKAVREVMSGGAHFDSALTACALRTPPARDKPSRTAVAQGLSEREQTVLRLIALGHTNKEIAAKLSLSVKTIESYKVRFARKAGLRGRAQIVRYALRRGWLNEADGALDDEPRV